VLPSFAITGILPSALSLQNVPQVVTVAGQGFSSGLSATLTDPSGNPTTFFSSSIANLTATSFQFTSVFALAGAYTLKAMASDGNQVASYSFSVTSSAEQWTWMGGANTTYTAPDSAYAPVYGTLGIPAVTNHPGPRMWAASWTGKDGNFWLFGGDGVDSSMQGGGSLNDLWQYNPSTGAWAWMSGTNTFDAGCSYGSCNGSAAHYGTRGVPSTANTPGSRMQPVTWVDSKGNLWLFGGDGADSESSQVELNDLWRYQP
jgi:hypothetical protein